MRAILLIFFFTVAPLGATAQEADRFDPYSLMDVASYLAGVAAFEEGDYINALKALEPLAESGNAAAQNHLGVMYEDGTGVPQDFTEAARWYLAAAEQGLMEAQVNLAILYDAADGVLHDPYEAARWFSMAAKQGYAPAQFILGTLYADGSGVLQDYVAAHMWFNIAGANGYESAPHVRELVANDMTPDSVQEAQRRARACMQSDYQDCD